MYFEIAKNAYIYIFFIFSMSSSRVANDLSIFNFVYHEMKSCEKFIFHGAAFFGVALWPITIISIPKNRIFTRRTALSGATF